jgi:hypothetical protein
MQIISKTQLADQLGTIPSAIYKAIRAGMPVCADGLTVDQLAALKWLAGNFTSAAAGIMMWELGTKAAKILRDEGET